MNKPYKSLEAAYLAAEAERTKSRCPGCFGSGRIAEAGMFSSTFRCDVCNGSGLKKHKRRAKR